MTEFTFRPITLNDIQAFHDVYGAASIEVYGSFAMTIEEMVSEFTQPGYNLETNSMAAFTPAGQIVAWADVVDFRTPPVRPYLYGYVRTEHRGKGLATQLVAWGIERCKQVIPRVPDNARVVIQAFSPMESGMTLLENNGFKKVREAFIMQIDMDEPPPKPQLPEGFHIETMANGATLVELVETLRGAFRDHRGYLERPFHEDLERWQHHIDTHEGIFEPELFMLLKEGDKPAGELMAWKVSEDDANKAEVASLGILPEYRRRGLAKQLLYTIFNEAYQRGKRSVSLNVDGSSLTGAHIVYQKVGMVIAQVYNAYELEIRSGIEISNQG